MKTGLRKLLLSVNDITSIVGDRVFVTRIPQSVDPDVEHILITQMSSEENKSLDGTSELRFLDFDIDCKANTSAKADKLSKVVREFLKDYVGPAGDQTISAVLLGVEQDGYEPPTDGSGEGLFVSLLDFEIQYNPA